MIRHLRVRMYRVGFGDCFLLTFTGDEPPRHVLIDCGSITETEAHVGAVVADVLAACDRPGGAGARIELVVCTHRHRDHVGGFKDPAWKGVEVGEVWMPWTEDPDDLAARRRPNWRPAPSLRSAARPTRSP
jgi:glyoxylase-like metal-dependent hydrolase (beta-lactamase superfamily II)